MKRTQSESIEFWRNHIIKAKSQPISTVSYCKANSLLESSFYYWRDKIFDKKDVNAKTKAKANFKKVKSPFLPVVISPAEIKIQSYPQQHRSKPLPDSQWVAEIITNVIRGLL